MWLKSVKRNRIEVAKGQAALAVGEEK
jgi:hypothetical protein